VRRRDKGIEIFPPGGGKCVYPPLQDNSNLTNRLTAEKIEKAAMRDGSLLIPIVFAADDNFIPYAAVTMQSIMENANSNNKYCFFVLHRDISEEFKELLKKEIGLFDNFTITFFDVSDSLKTYTFYSPNAKIYTQEAYFRLLIPYIFTEYEKVIYMDGDIVCNADISELYNIDLGNNLIAASRTTITPYMAKGIKKAFNMKAPFDYFCSGLLVFNVVQFQKHISQEELLSFAQSREWPTVDQDVLNVVCEGRTYLLSMQWNFLIGHWCNRDQLVNDLKDDFIRAKKDPKIIHFTGLFARGKPWNTSFFLLYSEYFWKYATRTPFITIIMKRMDDEGLIGTQAKDFLGYIDRVLSPPPQHIYTLHEICGMFRSKIKLSIKKRMPEFIINFYHRLKIFVNSGI